MNKIKIKDEIILSNHETREIYLFTKEDKSQVFRLNENSHLVVYHYNIDKNIEIEIYLDGEHAEVEYHFSTINYKNNSLTMQIYHNNKKTVSNVFNHGVNINNNNLAFQITGKVLKKSNGCICNQENQIINLENGKSTILPNLLIDNYDVSSSHSAYIGRFKDDILFYLMSRGLDRRKSNELLVKGLLLNGGDPEQKEVVILQKEIENI